MGSQQRLDAEVAGQLIPQRLTAAEQNPRLQVLGAEPAVAGQAGEVGEASMRVEVVMGAGEIEVGLTRAHGGEAVGDREARDDAQTSAGRLGDALTKPVRLVGGAGDGIGPRHGEPELLAALGQRGAASAVSAAAVAEVTPAAAAAVDFRNSRRSIAPSPLGKRRASKPIRAGFTTGMAPWPAAARTTQAYACKWEL